MRLIRLTAILSAVSVTSVAVLAQPRTPSGTPVVCDRHIRSRDQGPFGYKSRGDRCEGTYDTEVGLTLDVLSITREVPDLDLGTRDRLALSWSRPMAALQLRVMSKDHDAPYRMDAQPKDGTRSFVWNLDVLKRQHTAVGRSLELAALGFAAFGIASDKKPAHAVWTPIAFEGSAKASPDIVVTLSTSARVYKVFSTLASETPGGVQTVAWEDRCERSKTLQAHSPIEIRIPVPDAAPHLYNLEVRASGESGLTSSTLEILGR